MHEIIHVVEAEAVSGTFVRGLEIEAVVGRPLAAGYYFVLGPTRSRGSKQRGKRHFGPFQTRAEARLLMTSAVALGLADNEPVSPAIAECPSTARSSLAANDGCAAPRTSAWRDSACAA